MKVAFLVVGTMFLSACGNGTAPTRSAISTTSACPEVPVWHRNLDVVEDSGYPTPEEAVREAAGDEIEIAAVRTSGGSSEVDVRLADGTGVFFLGHVDTGWLVEGGEGCAAMPAHDSLVGEPDCVDPEPTPPEGLGEGDIWGYVCLTEVD